MEQSSTMVRSIDDYRDSGINGIYGSHDKLTLMDSESVSNLIRRVEGISSEETDEIVFSSWTAPGNQGSKTGLARPKT